MGKIGEWVGSYLGIVAGTLINSFWLKIGGWSAIFLVSAVLVVTGFLGMLIGKKFIGK